MVFVRLSLWAMGVWGCASAPPAHQVDPPRVGAVALAYLPTREEAGLAAARATVEQWPDRAPAWSALAVALLERKRATSSEVYLTYALDAAEAALALDPRDLRALQVQIRARHAQHAFPEAATLAAAAAGHYPHDVTLMLLHGDALLELGDYEGALEKHQAALDARPDLRTYTRGAHLRWVFGDLDGAIALAERAVRAGGVSLPEPTAFGFVDLARLHLHGGDDERALAAAQAALGLVPDYPAALSIQARALRAQGNEEAARVALRQRVERHPNVEDLLLLAELVERQGPAADARALRARAEGLAGSDPRALADDWARRGVQLDRALHLAEASQAARPTVEHLDTFALALLRVGRIEEAQRASERALAWGTAAGRLHVTRGLIALAGGDREGAAAALAQARGAQALAPQLYAELQRGLAES